ncbi:MAG: MATE family efflux transporter [Clostridia bacterium]|nr:MATE family efflux transporter [Clostridia bacterium]
MTKTINMTTGNPGKLIFFFALPLMFGNVFQQLYRVVDTAIVGQGVGMDALAALGTTDWLCWLVMGLASGFTQGFCVHMSQKFGEGDMPGLRKTIGVSAGLTIVIALVITLLSQLLMTTALTLLRVPAELRELAEVYSRIFFAGIPAMMFFNFTSSVVRSVGDSKPPLYAMIFSSAVNVVLDIVAVFVLEWGVAGAAWATVFAQCCAGAVCTIRIIRTPILHFRRQDMKWDGKLVGKLLYLGFPISFQSMIIAIGGMIVQTVVNGFGTVFIAGFTATNKLYGLLEMAAISYGSAVTTYVGQNYGANNLERIRKGVRASIWISLVTSVIIAILMLVMGRQFALLFISSESAELLSAACDVAYYYLAAMSVGLPMLYLLYVYISAAMGMGKTILPMISGIVECGVRVTLALVSGLWLGETCLYFVETASWIGATLLMASAYYIIMHKLKQKQMNEQKEGQ